MQGIPARFADLGRVAVISPHLDDGVFGCGELLAARPGALLITVFAGVPAGGQAPDWDRRCGFEGARQAVEARRQEDARAARVLDVEPVWLDLVDSQYGQPCAPADVAARLAPQLAGQRIDTVLIPLGLFHSDHALVHEGALLQRRVDRGRRWVAYEDALYRRMRGVVQSRVAELARRGIRATPWAAADDRAAQRKQEAVRCYASQLRAFGEGGYDDTALPERYWLLDDEEGGSERR
ncbi:PIG-L family deacetylase [Pigmentiphaga soli]|uniref:PIG-L family deacetylase n=1 Tax=Pigmentiphaga soli TaxID=1007095 RepID=A0ABP8GFS9_9BURK